MSIETTQELLARVATYESEHEPPKPTRGELEARLEDAIAGTALGGGALRRPQLTAIDGGGLRGDDHETPFQRLRRVHAEMFGYERTTKEEARLRVIEGTPTLELDDDGHVAG